MNFPYESLKKMFLSKCYQFLKWSSNRDRKKLKHNKNKSQRVNSLKGTINKLLELIKKKMMMKIVSKKLFFQ